MGKMGTSVKVSTIKIKFKKLDVPIINKQPYKQRTSSQTENHIGGMVD